MTQQPNSRQDILCNSESHRFKKRKSLALLVRQNCRPQSSCQRRALPPAEWGKRCESPSATQQPSKKVLWHFSGTRLIFQYLKSVSEFTIYQISSHWHVFFHPSAKFTRWPVVVAMVKLDRSAGIATATATVPRFAPPTRHSTKPMARFPF